VCLLVELMPRGSLRSVLKDPTFKFEWASHKSLAHDLATALAYLHAFSPPIVHRDVKPDNVSRAALPHHAIMYSLSHTPRALIRHS